MENIIVKVDYTQKGDRGPQGVQGVQGIQGNQGIQGVKGDTGFQGWTQVFVEESDGVRIIKKLSDYTGGAGAKPTANIGQWLKPDGTFTSVKADAKDYVLTGKIANWQAQVYAANFQILHLGKVWTSTTNTISTDVPGASAKWKDDGLASNLEVQQKLDSSAILNPAPVEVYKNPKGDAEYVGDANYYNVGVGIYVPAISSKRSFNEISVKAGTYQVAGDVTVRLYETELTAGRPDTDFTFLAETVSNFGINPSISKMITLPQIVTLSANKRLYVLFSSKSTLQTGIREWTTNPDGDRQKYLVSSSVNYAGIFNEVWTESTGTNHCSTPLILNLRLPLVYQAAYDVKQADQDTKIALALVPESDGKVTGAYIPQVQYLHPRGDAEMGGNTVYGQSSIPGLGMYEVMDTKVAFNKITLPMYATVDAAIAVRVYSTNGVVTTPQTMTLLEEVLFPAGTFNTVAGPGTKQIIELTGTYLVQQGYKVVVFAYKTAGTNIFMRQWNAQAVTDPLRHGFLLRAASADPFTTGSWGTGALPTYGQASILLELSSTALNELNERVDALESNEATAVNPRIAIPAIINAVVGKEENLYYDAIGFLPDKGFYSPLGYSYEVVSTKGKMGERCWSFTPVSGDIGTHVVTINVYDYAGQKKYTKSFNIVVIAASAPLSVKNALIAADSLFTDNEVSTILKGILDAFTALGSNVPVFWGLQGTGIYKHEAKGGNSWIKTATNTPGYFKFNVTGIGAVGMNAVYTNNGSSFTVREVNITGGTGYFKCERTAGSNAPLSSGTLTKASGAGDASIVYSSSSVDASTPFINISTGLLDFANYRSLLGMGATKFDLIYFQLGINDSIGTYKSDTTINAAITYAKSLITAALADSPLAKIILQLPTSCGNTKGGFGANYGASVIKEEYRANLHRLRELMISNFDAGAYHANVFIGPAGLVLDRYFGYTLTSQITASGYTDTEMVHTNAVHPSANGSRQIANGVFPQILNLLS